MSQRNLGWLLVVPALVLLVAVLSATAPPPDRDYALVRSVVDVLAEVDKNYYHQLDDAEKKKLVENMINGGLVQLDRNSHYFTADELKAFDADTRGRLIGIGAVLGPDPDSGGLSVESVMPDSPAQAAGMKAGDVILKVDGEPIAGKSVEQAKIRGEKGTPVTLTVRKEGGAADSELTLTRAEIKIASVTGMRRAADDATKWDYVYDQESGIAVIRVSVFSEETAADVKAALKQAEAGGAKAVVLDLRDNPGGLLKQAAIIADLFLATGDIVRTKTKDRGTSVRDFPANDDGSVYESAAKRPMAVLMNRGSASASEIVAAALQDNGRAAVAGERSYGKGSVQKVFPLSDNKAAVKLTSELWFTPNDRNIHRWPDSKDSDDWGVKPDAGLEVTMTEDERIQQELLLRSIDRGGRPEKAAAKEPKAGDPALPRLDPKYKDKTLEKAVEYLKGKMKDAN